MRLFRRRSTDERLRTAVAALLERDLNWPSQFGTARAVKQSTVRAVSWESDSNGRVQVVLEFQR